jgi:RNA polymerase sigma factor (TIGR02999 family)
MGRNPESHVCEVSPASRIDEMSPREAAPDFERVYAQLRRMARRELGAKPRATLCTTALVHEAWLKLGSPGARPAQHGAFLAIAAKAMRHVLIDHARRRSAGKRGSGVRAVTLDTEFSLMDASPGEVDLLALEQGLQMLGQLDPRLVSVVECHFFAGMDFAEIGETLGVAERTAQRDWRRARAFLKARLAQAGP